jgi:hypothetical protein
MSRGRRRYERVYESRASEILSREKRQQDRPPVAAGDDRCGLGRIPRRVCHELASPEQFWNSELLAPQIRRQGRTHYGCNLGHGRAAALQFASEGGKVSFCGEEQIEKGRGNALKAKGQVALDHARRDKVCARKTRKEIVQSHLVGRVHDTDLSA